MEKVKFNIKQLGNGSAFKPKSTNSSFLIEMNDSYLLFDCGYNVFEKLLDLNQANEIDLQKLKYIYISHLDDDHIGSLKSFCYYLYFTYNITPIIMGELIVETRENYLSDLTTQIGKSNMLENGKWKENNFIEFQELAFLYQHNPGFKFYDLPSTLHSKPCVGLLISGPGINIAITGDTKATPRMETLIKQITKLTNQNTIIFHDYSSWDDDQNNVHACKTDIEHVYTESFRRSLNYYHSDQPFDDKWINLNDSHYKQYDANLLTDSEAAHEYINGKTLTRSVWPKGAKISRQIKLQSKNLKVIVYEDPLHAVEENSNYNDWRIVEEKNEKMD